MSVTIAFMGDEDSNIKRRHHSPAQIVRKLREADRILGDGQWKDPVFRST